MGVERRAGAPRLIDWTGERCVPWAPDVQVVYEHFHRYLWASRCVAGRRVLDLGSGEGFGAAILAGVAKSVDGIDVDAGSVEHSRVNYSAANLRFSRGDARDLAGFDDDSFGAVVAFEVIEHLREQEQVMTEIARVLVEGGLLVISTPDRRLYSDASGPQNPFHERELDYTEFASLLAAHFPHTAVWGQRTAAGSRLDRLDADESRAEAIPNFFLERVGDDWRLAGKPAALYLVALASTAPLPALPDTSTLSDCGLEIVRVQERVAQTATHEREVAQAQSEMALAEQTLASADEHRKALAELGDRLLAAQEATHEREVAVARFETALVQRDREFAELARDSADERRKLLGELRDRDRLITHRDEEILARDEEILARDEEIRARDDEIRVLHGRLRENETDAQARAGDIATALADARQLNRRVEESVTWQVFQRVRARVFGAVGGEGSPLARAIRLSLRVAGRFLLPRQKQAASAAAETGPLAPPQQAAGAAAETGPLPPPAIKLPQFDEPKVSLIIPVRAHAELTRACLETIRDNTAGASYEVVVIDDAADPDTKHLLEQVQGATILTNQENAGYLRSVNGAAAKARGKWLVLCNNDIEVRRGWLQAMLDCAESTDDVGVVTPKFIDPDGRLSEAGGIVWRDGTGANYGRGDADPDSFKYQYRRETDYGSAAALMVSRSFWDAVGGYDERFAPMYYEDVDLCFEARERGLRVLYEPEAVVVDVEGATAGTDPESGPKRHQEQNRHRFVEKWRHRLEHEHLRDAPTNVRIAADRHRGPRVLIIDHRIPMWDRDAGSLRMLSIIDALREEGCRVTVMPDNLAGLEPYTRRLQRRGVEVLCGNVVVAEELAALCPRVRLVILSRPHTASRWLDIMRELAPAAHVVYDTVDLHWVREVRRRVSHDGGEAGPISPRANALRELELALVRATDETFVVTDIERAQLECDVPDAKVRIVPVVHDLEEDVVPPEIRSGVLFVGSFEHPPNVDAALWLVKGVMPAVWRQLGDVRVSIVGLDPPPEVAALASPLVDVTGWVEDLDPLLRLHRVAVAPIAFGAGQKGKVTQALAAGLPVVTTPIGAEGLNACDGEQMLIGATTAELAERVIRVYRDDELWWRLSRAGQQRVTESYSPAVIATQLREVLADATSTPDAAPRTSQQAPA